MKQAITNFRLVKQNFQTEIISAANLYGTLVGIMRKKITQVF